MAQPYVTGPCLVYPHVGGSLSAKQPLFLGTCEDSPQVRTEQGWEPLYNALGGCRLPSDTTFQGEEAHVRCDLTRWNESVLTRCMARPAFNGSRGAQPFGSLGTFMISENMAYPLTLTFPYATKPALNTMPAGLRFVAAYLVGPDEWGPLSTRPRKVSLVFHCMRLLNVRTLDWALYDHTLPRLPSPD